MVGAGALLLARLTRAKPAWNGLYWLGISLVFLFLALDEFVMLHEYTPNWREKYIVLGAMLFGTTAIAALRAGRNPRIFHLCFLTGLAMSAAGGIFLELMPPVCGNWAWLRLDDCLYFFPLEECLEFLGVWLTVVAVLGQLSNGFPRPQLRSLRVLYALPPLWIALLCLLSLATSVEVRLLAQPAAVELESRVYLRGYRMDRSENAIRLRLYASARQWDYMGLGYSVHLVDQVTGDSIASHDAWAQRKHGFWLFGPDDSPVFLQWMEINIPPETQTNHALWIILSTWRKLDGEFLRQKIRSSDLPLLDDTQVVLGEFVLPAASPSPVTAPLARFDNGFALDGVEMPEHAHAGENMNLRFTWRSGTDGSEDHVQFLHLGHEESGAWWVYDQQPLAARLPTRLWYDGLADSEIWQAPLPASLARGRYNVFTGLYRASDRERVPVSDAEGNPFLDARVPLGSLTID